MRTCHKVALFCRLVDTAKSPGTSANVVNTTMASVTSYKLKRQKSVPGHAVIRFGNWRTHEPTVVVENKRWLHMGRPEYVKVEFCDDEIPD